MSASLLHPILVAGTVAALGLAAVLGWSALGPETPGREGGGGADWGAVLAALESDAAFPPPARDRPVSLPADHAAHEAARSETWALSAHLTDAAGTPVGIQAVFSRYGLVPPGAAQDASPWRPRALHRAHVALSDGDAALEEERFSRGALGVAGHDAERGEIRLDHWRLGLPQVGEDGALTLEATAGEAAATLRLTHGKAPLLPEGDGGAAPFRGYAMTRLDAVGTVTRGGETRAVSGVAWFDHLWGDLPPPGGPVVYDRLQLHLADGTDLSLVRTRRRDGSGTASVDGFAVSPDGATRSLGGAEMRARDGADGSYPPVWEVEAGRFRLEVAPLVEDGRRAFVEPVWSGLVRAEGRGPEGPVSGVGTLNLTGYETP